MYSAALACCLDQRDDMPTRARDLRPVGENPHATGRADDWHKNVINQFEWAHAFDKAI
jgi:hypothetical protein